MAQQYYPNTEELLQVLQAELPASVYPQDYADADDPARRSYSSAELRAAATVLASLYGNLHLVANNKNIGTADLDGIGQWEAELFKGAQSDGSIDTRRQALLAKLRSSGGISLAAIYNVAAAILTPKNLTFEILPWSGQASSAGHTSAWTLGVSQLGLDTYLSLRDPLIGNRNEHGLMPLDNSLNYAAAGITQNDLQLIQQTAYTFEVVIYAYADDVTLATLNKQLTFYEPARSAHVITNNASSAEPDPAIYKASLPWRS